MSGMISRESAIELHQHIANMIGAFPNSSIDAALREYGNAIRAMPSVGVTDPTDAQTASACMSYRHDFGLLEEGNRASTMFIAREWLRAWRKEFNVQPAPAPSPLEIQTAASNEAKEGWTLDIGRGVVVYKRGQVSVAHPVKTGLLEWAMSGRDIHVHPSPASSPAVQELIEAAQWARNRLELIADQSWHGDGRDLKRSIVGVFADFDAALAKCGSHMPDEIRSTTKPAPAPSPDVAALVGQARLLIDTGWSEMSETVDYAPSVISKVIDLLDAALARKGGGA